MDKGGLSSHGPIFVRVDLDSWRLPHFGAAHFSCWTRELANLDLKLRACGTALNPVLPEMGFKQPSPIQGLFQHIMNLSCQIYP